ncbi:MAG TPA: hypothetical protein VJA21_19720 [Verrucomicrobiae bacterium]
MSLVRLLTTGKCLVGLRESANRYRLTSQRLLPKFESKKNPFGGSFQGGAGGAEWQSKPAGTGTEPDSEREGHAAAPAAVPSLVAAPAPVREGLAAWTWLWLTAARGRLFGRRRGPVVAATPLRPPGRMFQGELSLETVKVVRNDLSDSDVEIAAPKTSAPASRAGAGPVGQGEGPVQAPWARVASRLFGAAKH